MRATNANFKYFKYLCTTKKATTQKRVDDPCTRAHAHTHNTHTPASA